MIETLGEGELVGWSWLFPPYRCSFDARAVELTRRSPSTAPACAASASEDTSLGYELMQRFAAVMLDRLQATRLQLLDVYGQPAAG